MSQQYTCGHAPEVMCRECHPEAFDNAITNVCPCGMTGPHSCAYGERDTPLEVRLMRAKPGPTVREVQEVYDRMNPDPHDACRETIRAREREATDLRYRVRELNRHLERQQELYDNAQAERDEWKAKAEHYEAVAQRKVNEVESLKSAPHYCCMHMRWETQRGEKV